MNSHIPKNQHNCRSSAAANLIRVCPDYILDTSGTLGFHTVINFNTASLSVNRASYRGNG